MSVALCVMALVGCSDVIPPRQALTPLTSGTEFLTPETQTMQADTFLNPGYLWVSQGETLFQTSPDGAKACAECHASDALRGAATRFPKVDTTSGELQNLEGRINQCRVEHQTLPPLPYEGNDLLSLTTYVANLSAGQPIHVSVANASKVLAEGETYFFTRRGQFNLSCAQCHDDHWGQQLRGDIISQGHSNGFPAYRLEWDSVGSLHRRFADCDRGVRAEPLPLGSPTYIALELYLANRAKDLSIESPAIRR